MKLSRFAALAVLGAFIATPVLAQSTPSPSGAITPRTGTSNPSAAGPATGTKAAPNQGAAQTKPLDINTASPAELDALPGIGKARADAIVKNRPYKSKDELVSRHVLPKNVYDNIKDRIIAKQG